ncbi:hypothetical protein [Fodinibius sediminis]|uniref:Uncharacterized protein n=1 Tax=Fodinibius sediminis TaxID=1214077 RepID=A0A521AUR8_9BACT|nr:hypothetical protein [Fodinibius sediminis]SMO38554.1 hypothetical protein SAMN06265218_101380 [Fodinibius sediminis]
MNSRRDKREELQSEARHQTIELVSNLVPFGNLAYKTFTAISKPLYIQRREEWIKDISLRLLRLEEQDKIKLEDLAGSDEFNTILIKASNLAQEHHQEEKINALKGIVINTSLDLSKDK